MVAGWVDNGEVDDLAQLGAGAGGAGAESAIGEAAHPVLVASCLDVAICPVGRRHIGIISERPGVSGRATGNYHHLDHLGAGNLAVGQETGVGNAVRGALLLAVATYHSVSGEGFDVAVAPVARRHIGVTLLPTTGGGEREAEGASDNGAELGAVDIVVGMEVAVMIAAYIATAV